VPWDEDLPVHLADVGVAAKGHGDVQLAGNDLQALAHPGLAHGTQAIEERAADQGAFGTERHRLEHVLATADAAVHRDLDALTHGLRDPGGALIAPSSWRPP